MTFRNNVVAGVAVLTLALAGCGNDAPPSNKAVQAQRAEEAANSINFTENAEIDNIKRRLTLTSKPDALGFVLLMNEMGQPIMYASVQGKITSGGKRLTEPDRHWNDGNSTGYRQAASDEGTYGSSGEYIYFWTTDDQYVQWNGKYLYSNQAIRTSVPPLVVNVK